MKGVFQSVKANIKGKVVWEEAKSKVPERSANRACSEKWKKLKKDGELKEAIEFYERNLSPTDHKELGLTIKKWKTTNLADSYPDELGVDAYDDADDADDDDADDDDSDDHDSEAIGDKVLGTDTDDDDDAVMGTSCENDAGNVVIDPEEMVLKKVKDALQMVGVEFERGFKKRRAEALELEDRYKKKNKHDCGLERDAFLAEKQDFVRAMDVLKVENTALKDKNNALEAQVLQGQEDMDVLKVALQENKNNALEAQVLQRQEDMDVLKDEINVLEAQVKILQADLQQRSEEDGEPKKSLLEGCRNVQIAGKSIERLCKWSFVLKCQILTAVVCFQYS